MDIQPFLPLTETTFYLLLSLQPGPRHGYAILKDVENLSSNRITLSTGTLYGAIKRLVEQEWIIKVGSPDEVENGRNKKEYQLTDLGRKIFNAEYSRLHNLVTIAATRIAGEQS